MSSTLLCIIRIYKKKTNRKFESRAGSVQVVPLLAVFWQGDKAMHHLQTLGHIIGRDVLDRRCGSR